MGSSANPFLLAVERLPVHVFTVERLASLPRAWTKVGDAPTDDAAIVIGLNMETAVAWVPRRNYMGESLEALAHELGHLLGHRRPGQLLASEEDAMWWEINAIRQLDRSDPVTRAMANKAASVASDVLDDLPEDVRAWLEPLE